MTKEKIQQKINARNALSQEQHARDLQNFVFDLQLFGGGGKDGGKVFGAIIFGALTAGFGAALGLATHGVMATLSNFMLGASLFSGIWTATHQQDSLNSSDLNVKRFDKAQESVSSEAVIPVVYGERLVTGNQTWHETNGDAQTLHKHVVLCEGGINAIKSVTANDLIIPTGGQQSNTVFTLQNTKYTDAVAYKNGKTFYIKANGKEHSIYLANKDDTSGDFWSYQINVSALVTYINSLHNEGWQAFPYAATNAYPGDLLEFGESYQYISGYKDDWDIYEDSNGRPRYRIVRVPVYSTGHRGINCYLKPIDVRASTVAGGTKYEFHDCETPSNYATVGGYPKMAWLDLTFTTQSDFSGNPTVSCVIQGRKIYDTRTGKTSYSTNPAMCLRDFLLSKRYGLGKWFSSSMLDDESWKESANYCDQVITFRDGSGALVKAKRYELNMVIDQKRSGLEWVQEILACFAGFLVYSDGKLKLRIEKPTPVSYKFTDSNCSNLKISPLKLSETPNKYEVTIIDPLNNWSSIKALCEDFADQKLRQRIVTKEVSLEGVTSQNQALRLARFYRDYNLVCPIQVSFTTGMQAMHLEPGDVVTIDYHGVFKGMPIRIAEIKETSNGTFEISGRQYNSTIYGDELGGGVHWYNYSEIGSPLSDRVPNVKNLTLDEDSYVDVSGTYFGHITATWKPPAYQFLSGYDVYYRFPARSSNWTFLGNTPETEFVINNIPKLARIDVLVKTVNTYDRKSDGTKASITTVGKNSPPGPVTKFVAGQYGNEMRFVFSGVMPSDPDIAGAEIRRDGKTWDDAIPVVTVSMLPYTLENQDFDDGTHLFRIKAFDTVGNYSEESVFTLTVRDINEFKNIILERDDIALRDMRYGNGFIYNDDGYLINVWGMTFGDIENTTFHDIENVTWRTGGVIYDNDGHIIKVWWMKFSDLGDLTFGDIEDAAWMVGGTADTRAELISPKIDTFHADLTTIRYVFDIALTLGDPTWDDIWDRTFKDVQGQTFFNLSSKTSYDTYIRYSDDNETWTDWQLYLAATYHFRYIQYKLVFNDIGKSSSIKIKSLKQYYDVPDFNLSTRGTTNDGYVRVNFDKELYKVPTQISFIVTDVGAVVSPVVIPTKSYVDIYTYDASGAKKDVNFLLTVNGY